MSSTWFAVGPSAGPFKLLVTIKGREPFETYATNVAGPIGVEGVDPSEWHCQNVSGTPVSIGADRYMKYGDGAYLPAAATFSPLVGVLASTSREGDRNPLSRVFFGAVAIGPNTNATLWTYTVPAGRRFRIETCQVETMIETPFDDADGNIETGIGVFPGAGEGTFVIDALIHNGANVAGTRASAAIGAAKELQTGDTVQGMIVNGRSTFAGPAGFAFHLVMMTGTESDA